MKKRIVLVGALCAALAVCLLAWAGRSRSPYPRPTPLPVLMLHHLVPDGTPCNDWTLTESAFRENMAWLSEQGYTTVLPSEIVRGDPLPEKPVLLTFDDGYASNYTLAYPILQEFQAKAVVSLITRRVEEGNPEFLTWEMCRKMAASGLVEFGSHTHDLHSGPVVDGITRLPGEARAAYQERVEGDLQTSIDLIEGNVGSEVHLFAYPHGLTEPWAKKLLGEKFTMTVSSVHRVGELADGLYQVPRMNVTMEEGFEARLG